MRQEFLKIGLEGRQRAAPYITQGRSRAGGGERGTSRDSNGFGGSRASASGPSRLSRAPPAAPSVVPSPASFPPPHWKDTRDTNLCGTQPQRDTPPKESRPGIRSERRQPLLISSTAGIMAPHGSLSFCRYENVFSSSRSGSHVNTRLSHRGPVFIQVS